MSLVSTIKRIFDHKEAGSVNCIYQYCPRCDANLTMQRDYSADLPYWTCLGCGEMLINPDLDSDSDTVWVCDECEEILNIQPGFSEDCGTWKCTSCGHINCISPQEIYDSEDEYQAALRNPYKGIDADDIAKLSCYCEEKSLSGKGNVFLVKNLENGILCVKKILTAYDRSVYDYLKSNPIKGMPRIYELFEGDNCLVVLEEFISGSTITEILEDGSLPEERVIKIAHKLCDILKDLHRPEKPIVHRDIKPSNIIVNPDDNVFLLDINAAKWYDSEKNDDTVYIGTQHYAAPEQIGYGFTASTPKSDIYAVGMLMNVMLTCHFPKEEKASGPIWHIIERCISLEADQRYTADELSLELDDIGVKE